MSEIPTKEIAGDVSVGRHVTSGGDVTVRGNVSVDHDLTVKGWLKAANILGVNRGLFDSVDALYEAYPIAGAGTVAIVGDSETGTLYKAEDGEWVSTGKTATVYYAEQGGANLMTLQTQLAELQAEYNGHIETYNAVKEHLTTYVYPLVEAHKTSIALHQSAITALEGELSNQIEQLQTQIDTITDGDTSTAIENLNEIKNFLNGFADDETLAPQLLQMTNNITTLTTSITGLNSRLNALPGASETIKVLQFDGVAANMASRPSSGIYYIEAERRFYDCEADDEFLEHNVDEGTVAREDVLYRMSGYNELYRYSDPEGLFRYVDSATLATVKSETIQASKLALFVDMWTDCYDCQYDASKAKPFTCNQIDLTYEEAIKVYNNPRLSYNTIAGINNLIGIVKTVILASNGTNGPTANFEHALRTSTFESVRVSAETYFAYVSNARHAFHNCTNLKYVLGFIRFTTAITANSVADMFSQCYDLEQVRIHSLAVSISFEDCPKLSRESYEYMVENAIANLNTGYTITVHPDVYAKMGLQQKWMDLVDDGAEKGITFATTE